MKPQIKHVAALAFGLVFSGTQLFANTTKSELKVLSENEWTDIQVQAELESINDNLAIEEIPALGVATNTLDIDLQPGAFTTMKLDAPFLDNETVGLVVMDAEGEVIYRDEGLFKDKKILRFRDYFDYDMTYVVKVYSDLNVYETKVQVAYR